MYSSRQGRALRGIAVASAATMLALFSHVIGGGESPHLIGLAMPWLLSLPVCVGLTGKKLSFWKLLIAVSASQLLFHTLFVLGTPTSGGSQLNPHAGHGGIPLVLPPADPSSTVSTALAATPSMWVMHGLAAIATAALVYRGERAVLRLRDVIALTVRWFCHRVATYVVPVSLTAGRARHFVPQEQAVPAHAKSAALAPLRRRGPPPLHAL